MNERIHTLAHSQDWADFSQWVTILLGVVLFTLGFSSNITSFRSSTVWLMCVVSAVFTANLLNLMMITLGDHNEL